MAEVYGMPVADLPKGWTPVRCVIAVECLDENGALAISTRSGPVNPGDLGIALWDAVGLSVALADRFRRELIEGWRPGAEGQ